MKSISRYLLSLCLGTIILGHGGLVGASQLVPAFGLANEQFAKTAGPYNVSTNAVLGDCRGLLGVLARILLLDNSVQCNQSFPYGFSNPISTSVYYPSNIKTLDKLPVINFVGGILSNQGQYTNLLRLWASYGFIVVVSSDFINTAPSMHVLGAVELSKLNQDPTSPLFGKVDLSRTIVAGHSAGGGASILSSSLAPETLRAIDPQLSFIGSLPIEPGPIGLGSTVRTPTLVLTGAADVVVPAWAWPRLWQGGLIRTVPGWSATAHNATHFSPVRVVRENEFAGITTAWVLYVAKNDPAAREYFVGKDYKLAQDPQFIRLIFNPLRVQRNEVADELQ
ncbi:MULTISPECIES: alpha/beta hydrolase [Pseudomonas]|uniref:Alpha/beta hydrolase n=2 Tax=Pseudomonas TaxID=286 RepID=A0ABX8MIU4_9PSED|nr:MULTISPECIES: alpha/beta hydrolase [Pseudomonas]AZC26790.1 Adenylate cyclase [Pseudomonas sessilinigenes]QIH07901.1 alpha/beta hydrolase [Pseudomonas sp. BIOMIG1BAC]QXH39230.1 alpha/beta hydrolase [Pseudomonas sessilinigenes]UMZ09219.1 alpha/beta hydrolase [Pseudomonas sp. MPFS]